MPETADSICHCDDDFAAQVLDVLVVRGPAREEAADFGSILEQDSSQLIVRHPATPGYAF